MRILIPDARFPGEPDAERAAAPSRAVFDVHRGREPEAIPGASWRAAEAVVVWHVMTIPAQTVDLLNSCRIIVRAGIGVDNIDADACARRGIPVCNCPDYGVTDVADHAIALYLSLSRGIAYFQQALAADPVVGWRWDAPPLITRVRGRKFGVVGLGRIGTATVRRARAFDMEVGFHDPYLPSGQEQAVAAWRAETLEDLLAWADVVSLHAPLTAETRYLIDAAALNRFKEGAILVNTARGALVDLDAVHEALKSNRLAGAGLDVLPGEPPDPDHPLIAAYREGADWLRGRLVLSPHAAFYSAASFADLRRKPVETAVRFMEGRGLRNCVNLRELERAGFDPA